jgi:hypothetical protein
MRSRILCALVAIAALTSCSAPDRESIQQSKPAMAPTLGLTPTVRTTRTVNPGPPPVTDSIPKGFMLYENDGAMREDDLPFVLECFGRPEAHAATHRHVGKPAAQGTTIEHSLYVYVDEAAARRVFSTARRDLPRCFGLAGARLLKEQHPRWGDEAAAVTVAKPPDGAGEYTGAPLRMVGLRVGRAIALFYGYPEIPEIDRDARAVVARLCRYDGGCAASTSPPSPAAVPSRGHGLASPEVQAALRTYVACMRSHGFAGESHPNNPPQAIMNAEEDSSAAALALVDRYRGGWRTCVKPYQQAVDDQLYDSN